MARRDPSDPQVLGRVPSQLEHLCSATMSKWEHRTSKYIKSSFCESTRNNLSSQILEDGSAVDGRSASNPPQPLLVFHLRQSHSQLRNIHLLWEAFVNTELKMFSSPSHPPCSISSGNGKLPPPSTFDGSWIQNLKSIRWQIKRPDV